MNFGLTTRWNAGRHTSGEAMVEEILEMGFTRLELGYDLRLDLVPGVERMVEQKAVRVDSVHNFCPLPPSAPRGHPELFTLASPDRRTRELAVQHTTRTLHFARSVGARVVVTHAGNVSMKHLSGDLLSLHESGQQFSIRYEKMRLKLQALRQKKARKQVGYLYEGIQRLLPVLEDTGVQLALENLPSWEAFPTEVEMEGILQHFDSPLLRVWHDIGHGRIRQNLGFINQERWLERLQPALAGFHVHDVLDPGVDHVMPPRGDIDFPRLAKFARLPVLKVIEPSPRTPREDIMEAHRYLREVWSAREDRAQEPDTTGDSL